MTGFAAGKHIRNASQSDGQDQIEVIGHVPLNGDSITRFVPTEHYRREYLYAEHESGKLVTLVDVTHVNRPTILTEMAYPKGVAEDLVAVTGNAALVSTDGPTPAMTGTPQTFRVMSFADPLHPTVQREFTGVTAMTRDDRRGLIFLANADGIWILQQKFAIDPAQAKLEHDIERTIYDTP